MLYLGYKESEYISMNILRILADNGMDYETKNEALEKYDIRLKGGLAKEVRSMCDYGDYVEKMGTEKGLQKGIAQGLQRGILQGKEQGFLQGSENKTVEDIQSLTKTLKLSVDEAMDALQIPIEERANYLKLLEKSF